MALTAMMRQYMEIKEQYKDTIVLYRLGDFYEMFFEDAVTASEVLGLTLTGRDCGLAERAPMCGVPFHAVDSYLAKLIEAGFKVAICEQVTKPSEQKGLVERRVVKVVTKGTITNSDLLKSEESNYLAAVYFDEQSGAIGVAWSDISTGELGHYGMNQKINHKLNEILSRLSPSEIICNSAMLAVSEDLSVVKYGSVCRFSLFNEASFDYSGALKVVEGYFPHSDFAKIQKSPECVCALGALLDYINATQKRWLNHLAVSSDEHGDFMSLDANSRKNLEILSSVDGKRRGSLLWVIDRTSTPMGARKLKNWLSQPITNETEINERLTAVDELFCNSYLTDQFVDALRDIKDLERLTSRVASSEINPRECYALGTSLQKMPVIKELLAKCKSPRFDKISSGIGVFDKLANVLTAAIDEKAPTHERDGGFIRDGFNDELDEYREINKNAKAIIAKIEQDEREETGIKNLKIGYSRVFGYYIEVSKSQLNMVPYRFIRKQTVAGGERFFTEELKNIETKILSSEEQAVKLEIAIFERLIVEMSQHVSGILSSARMIAYLDCLVSHAVCSRENGYCKPKMGANAIKLTESRHPVVEALIKSSNFVPNDVLLDDGENRINLITGPNMAGKSVYMRQVALIVILAHIGCFVPARAAEICITDRIFTRIGASDDLATGRSTFMVEMSEVANILENATDNSLLLFDEVGRGTSTYDGLSIAWSLLEHLSANLRAKIMFSTHYHELTKLEGSLDGLKNYKLTIREVAGSIVFLRKVMRGSANKSFGIEVAAISGLPKPMLERAKQILKKLELTDITNSNSSGSQLSLFNSDIQSQIISVLKDIDIDNTSPKEAHLILEDLQQKAQQY